MIFFQAKLFRNQLNCLLTLLLQKCGAFKADANIVILKTKWCSDLFKISLIN